MRGGWPGLAFQLDTSPLSGSDGGVNAAREKGQRGPLAGQLRTCVCACVCVCARTLGEKDEEKLSGSGKGGGGQCRALSSFRKVSPSHHMLSGAQVTSYELGSTRAQEAQTPA